MAVTELELARLEHEQASRNVRRYREELRYRRSSSLDNLYLKAINRQRRAAAELERLEATAATPPDGAGSRHATELETEPQPTEEGN